MKFNYLTPLLITFVMSSGFLMAQVIDPPCEIPGATLCDNIDAYESGEAIGPQSSWWTTWSGSEGGGEDSQVSTDYASSGSNSMKISEGGSNDVILKLGNQTSGYWRLEWMMYVPDGKTGYYNIQESETAGLGWNLELLFGLSAVGSPSSSGEGTISIPLGTGDFTYPVDAWFKVEHLIDLDGNTCDVYVDGIYVGSAAFTGSIGSIDFFSVDANCRYFIDDVLFTDVVNVTYQVDIQNYLAAGAVLSAGGMRIGGNFTDNGSTIPNWSPADAASAMTNVYDDVWEITAQYPLASAGNTQQFKYVNGDWFPTGENEYDDGAASLFGVLGCGGDNREVIIPSMDATYLFCWEECAACEPVVEECVVTIPSGIYVDDITATAGTVHWDAVTEADQYVGAVWNLTTGVIRKFRISDATSYTFPNPLTPSTTYGVRMKMLCLATEEFSAYSDFYYFTTSPLRAGEFAQKMDVYPNPNTGTFNLQLSGYENSEIQIDILSITGQKVYAQNLQVNESEFVMKVQLNNVSAGTYFARIMNGNSVETYPIIIE